MRREMTLAKVSLFACMSSWIFTVNRVQYREEKSFVLLYLGKPRDFETL